MASMTAPPFDGVLYDTIDDLMKAIQYHAKQEGWAIVKTRAGNRRENGQYYRYDLECDRGTKKHPNISTGLRKVASRKEECTWRGRAVALKANNDRWTYTTLNSSHNHVPSLDPSVHPMHRRRTAKDLETIQRHTKAGSRLHTVAMDLREDHPELKRKDIINGRAKMRREVAGPYTQTQLFIKTLQDSGEFFRICRGPDNRIIGVFWTFPWCKEMVKNYPDVLSMDNTYNINRFGMPLFEVTGTTPRKTVFPVAFALASSETQEAFTWLTHQLRDLFLEDIGLVLTGPNRQVQIIITDDDTGMKAAISETFPEVQQQICIWHIQKNVLKNLSQKWTRTNNTANSARPALNSTPSSSAPSVRIADLASPNIERVEAQATENVEHTYLGMLQMWTRVCWAKDVEVMRERWTNLCSEFEPDQYDCIRYLQGQWLPRGHQFLYCFTRHYRNFGMTSSQGSEAQHFSSKVFFDDNLSDLYTLLSRLHTMVEQKALEWKQQYAQEAAIPRHVDRNVVLKKNLIARITYRALDLIHEQYLMASSARLGTHEIGECSGAFTTQLGLPCKHTIYTMLRVETSASGNRKVTTIRPLEMRDVCKYWRLPHLLGDVDPLLLEEDPRVVARRGRPRNAPEDGIVLPRGTAVRRPNGQPSWHREPSGHEFLETRSRSNTVSSQRTSQQASRAARQLAAEGFQHANSQGSNRQEVLLPAAPTLAPATIHTPTTTVQPVLPVPVPTIVQPVLTVQAPTVQVPVPRRPATQRSNRRRQNYGRGGAVRPYEMILDFTSN